MAGRSWRAGWLLLLAVAAGMLPAAAASARPPRTTQAIETRESNFFLADWELDVRLSFRSLSVGLANHGRVHNAVRMPMAGSTWRFVPDVANRQTNFGTEALVSLLVRASAAVADRYPGSLLYIGNIGHEKGGKIPQSKSHQSGRDVDVAFYMLDADGKPVPLAKFMKIGKDAGAAGGMKLDVARTWFFVRTLLSSDEPAVQWIFVSNDIRDVLLAHAKEKGEPEWLLMRAELVLKQPSDSAPHADHMHVRIACSQWDKLVGCRDYGPRRPWFGQDEAVVAEYVDGLMRRIDRGSPAERLAAAERLAYINSKKAYDALSSLLCERDSQLVESALSGMKRISADEVPETVLAKLACAPTPSVSVVLFERVMRLRDERVWEAARGILKRAAKEKGCEGEQCPAYAVLVADAATALGFSANLQDGELLVAFIESPEPEIARAAAAALRTLYATDTPVLEAPVSPDGKQEKKGKKDKKAAKGKKGKKQPSEAEQWRAYVAARKDLDWKTHVHASLVAAGLKPDDDLLSRKSIPALLKAVKLGGPLAYSAAVALSQILQSPMPWVLEPDEALGRFKKLAGDK